ncbi:M61 family metallopeptidase [Sulfurirhabdus autotrophica]|uniref:Putative metalloprotease with PDZ domain n=1 Tax=Sulfurirhabdus autotrophica TaxID=1706046 RepID=A0A4R3YF82_9PROT|nr:PDZ domain-containing protein [Sulfurirhabdus autotrophica]TCV89564.1 putative metalloprotease with PDZ domain [Sulfurirhabdus autotrophica]
MTNLSPIQYQIYPKNPAAHLFEIVCIVSDPDEDGQRFSLPAWIPGSYMIREFAKNIVQLSAECNGKPVVTKKLDKDTWQCAPCDGPMKLTYEVYAWDLSVRAAHLDNTHGYFNGTSVFLMVQGKEDRPCIVDIRPPVGDVFQSWRVGTAMSRDSAAPYGFGLYRAENYDELVDHPVEMGEFTLATFEACGVPHDIIITGRHRSDMDRLCTDLKKICEHHIRFFGEPAPMDRYVFMVMAVGDGYGGLEHRASTSLLCSRDDLPKSDELAVSEGYRTFLGLCSHEYFHTWNVKRIKPKAFLPYELSRESYTPLLWAFEGITSYYDDLALLRCGLITQESYLELLGQTATRVWRSQGRFKQTLEESSFDAWTKFYRQDENAPNAIVSYYTKGALVALALDLSIRSGTNQEKSLDDVMRALWQEYGLPLKGVPDEGVEKIVLEVTGLPLQDFFHKALRSTEDLPLNELLAPFGVAFMLRAAESENDKGGKPSKKSEDISKARAVLGAKIQGSGDARLSYVFDGGAAQEAGLAAGDVIMAINGLRAASGNLEQNIGGYPVGETLELHVFRRDELMVFNPVLKAAPLDTCVLTLMDNADVVAVAQRNNWLGFTERD